MIAILGWSVSECIQIVHPAEEIGTSEPGSSLLRSCLARERNHTYIQILVAAKKSHTIHHHQGHDLSRPLPYSEMVRHVADVAQHQYMYLLLVMCVYSPSY